MLRTYYIVLSLLVIAGTCTSRSSLAADGCCAHCGCAAPCQKVCRLECGEKKVEVICWGCKKEDFCLPAKSQRGDKHCVTVCDDCEANTAAGVCAKPKNFVWFDWCPGCGTVHTRTKLMRRVETVSVPSYKWVIEDLCTQCAANAAAADPSTIVYSPPAETVVPIVEEEKSIYDIVRLPKLLRK